MSDNPYSAPTASLDEKRGIGLLDVAIGDNNTEYYIRYLEASGGRPWAASWHWPAFFFTAGWLLYRKLWLEWFLYVFVLPISAIVVGQIVMVAVSATLGAIFQSGILLGCYFIFMPVFANALYARKIRNLLAKADAHSNNKDEQIQWLQRHGGTSIAWLLILLLPALIGVLAAIALPAYQDYVEAANAAANQVN